MEVHIALFEDDGLEEKGGGYSLEDGFPHLDYIRVMHMGQDAHLSHGRGGDPDDGFAFDLLHDLQEENAKMKHKAEFLTLRTTSRSLASL